jgi:hypothetical protein
LEVEVLVVLSLAPAATSGHGASDIRTKAATAADAARGDE